MHIQCNHRPPLVQDQRGGRTQTTNPLGSFPRGYRYVTVKQPLRERRRIQAYTGSRMAPNNRWGVPSPIRTKFEPISGPDHAKRSYPVSRMLKVLLKIGNGDPMDLGRDVAFSYMEAVTDRRETEGGEERRLGCCESSRDGKDNQLWRRTELDVTH
jgi:hypothetical protein